MSMLGESLKTFPAVGSLNTEISDLDEVRPIFTDLVNDLRKLVKKQADHVMLPMECHYLNKAALISVVSCSPRVVRLFNTLISNVSAGRSTAGTDKTFYG